MREKVPSPNKLEHTPEQIHRFWNFIMGDDMDFYEEQILHLSDDEQRKFFQDNPDFMSKYLSSRDRIDLLKDKTYREILRKIKEYEGGKRYALILKLKKNINEPNIESEEENIETNVKQLDNCQIDK